MYENNFLAKHLRSASVGREAQPFAETIEGSVVSYADFFKGAEQFASVLLSKGVKPNDRVAVQVDKSIEVLQLYVGTVLAGGVFLPLNTAYTTSEIAYFLGDATPTVFVCRGESREALAAVAKEAGVERLRNIKRRWLWQFIRCRKTANWFIHCSCSWRR